MQAFACSALEIMLTMNDLKPGVTFILENDPYEVMESKHVKFAQGRPVMQTKVRNLINGKVFNKTFHQSDTLAEAEIEKQEVKFLFSHRGQFTFSDPKNPADRFTLSENQITDNAKWLKSNLIVEAMKFNNRIINIKIPIKIDYRVIEAPPGVKGDTAQGGVKAVKIETGAAINVPLFINEGDVIKINTESGEYVERVSK